MPDVVPTEAGQDLQSADGKYDAHVRMKRYPGKMLVITADVFDSSVKDAKEAHVGLCAGANTPTGAYDVTEFLKGFGFNVRVTPG